MVRQAEAAGVEINNTLLVQSGLHEVTSPAVHDSTGGIPFFDAPHRDFKYLDDRTRVPQQQWIGFGMDYQSSQRYIDNRYIRTCGGGRSRRPCKTKDHQDERTLVGMIDETKASYSQWLKANYNLDINISVRPAELLADGRPRPVNP